MLKMHGRERDGFAIVGRGERMGHSDPSLRSSMNGRDFKESC